MVLKAWPYDQLKIFPVTFIFGGEKQKKMLDLDDNNGNTGSMMTPKMPLRPGHVNVMLLTVICSLGQTLLQLSFSLTLIADMHRQDTWPTDGLSHHGSLWRVFYFLNVSLFGVFFFFYM